MKVLLEMEEEVGKKSPRTFCSDRTTSERERERGEGGKSGLGRHRFEESHSRIGPPGAPHTTSIHPTQKALSRARSSFGAHYLPMSPNSPCTT